MKPVVYVAGPFRGKPNIEWNRQQNIRRAEAAALRIWKAGAVAICPHKNTEHFDGALPDEAYLEGDLEILKRCDMILMLDGWTTSAGAVREREYALHLGIEVLYDYDIDGILPEIIRKFEAASAGSIRTPNKNPFNPGRFKCGN